MSVSLPSKFDYVYAQSFYVTFTCGLPEFGNAVAPQQFQAYGLLMPDQTPKPCKINCNQSSGSSTTDSHIVDQDGYWLGSTYFFYDFEHRPYNETLFDWQVATGNFVPTGKGPYLRNKFFETEETRMYFRVDPGQSFDWEYSIGNHVGLDTISQRLFKFTNVRMNVTIDLDKAAVIMFAEAHADSLSIGLKHNFTEWSLAGNYTIEVKLRNFLNQLNTTTIVVELVGPEPPAVEE